MKKSTKILMSALLTASLALPTMGASAATQSDNSVEKIRVYVEANNASTKEALKKQYQVRWELSEHGFSTDMNENQFAALQKNKNVTVTKVQEVSLDNEARATQSQNQLLAAEYPTHQTPWGIKAIYNNSNQTTTTGGAGINIAVLDTGVYTGHYDLKNTVEQCKDFTQVISLTNNSCTDGHGHGTHVAGTALADGGSDKAGIYGVAPDADLWAYKVLNDAGSGFSDDIAAAIRHVGDQSVATGTKTVINMSLGSSGNNSLISSAVTYAYDKGVLVVAAAGNDGSAEGTIGYPGALVNAIAVASLENVQQNGTYRIANYSSRGYSATDGDYIIQQGDVEVSAPGSAVYSTWNTGGYNTISGTSMATPHVAGLAAKLWASNPSWSNTTLRTDIQNRAKNYDIKGGTGATTGDDYASGFGFARVQ